MLAEETRSRGGRFGGAGAAGSAVLAWSAALLLAGAAAASAQAGSVIGVVVQEGSLRPVAAAVVLLTGVNKTAVTDSGGAFRLLDIPAGRYSLEVRHLAHGARSVALTVAAGVPTRIQVVVGDTAIALEPLTVEAFSREERAARGAGFRRGIVNRAQIAESESRNMDLSDVLRLNLPGINIRRLDRVPGSPVCIETRTIRSTNPSTCLSPAVYLDGVIVTNPTLLYPTLPLQTIESIEVVPANEAGVRFGTHALYGALLIETRRPGGDPREARERALRVGPEHFQWTADANGHHTALVIGASVLGNAAGLGLGTVIAKQCLHLREPSNDGLESDCSLLPTLAVGLAAMVLPAIGSSAGTRFAGRTPLSEGKVMPATIGAAMAILPGYSLLMTGHRNDSEGLRIAGYAVLLVGAPLISTAADYLFRRLRGDPD
jgi:hypothetical protein